MPIDSTAQKTTLLPTELNEFLDILSEKELPGRTTDAIAKRVESVLTDEKIVSGLRVEELGFLIERWNRRLRISLRPELIREKVLCGFNAFEDVVYEFDAKGKHTDESGKFLEWVAHQMGLKGAPDALKEAALKEAEGILPRPRFEEWCKQREKDDQHEPEKRKTAALKMLVTLLEAVSDPTKEWKPILDRVLWKSLYEYLRHRSNSVVKTRMGGASGNMAHVLPRLGVKTTSTWPFHSEGMADDVPAQGFDRLDLTKETKDGNDPATKYGSYSGSKGGPRLHPVRRSFVFDFKKGFTLGKSTAAERGRVIFIAPKHIGDRTWNELEVRAANGERSVAADWKNALPEDTWPFFPIFHSWRVEGDTLIVDLPSCSKMRWVAQQYDYFLLSGIQSINDDVHLLQTQVDGMPSEPIVGTLIKHALQDQLSTLADNGVVIHWEIGGISSPKLLDNLADIAGGRIKSAGLNHEELAAITDGKKFKNTRYSCSVPAGSDPFLKRYHEAQHLAGQLDLDELYVHGNDIDLIVRRRTTRGALRQEIGTTLFAKGVVLLGLLQRSVPQWQEDLRKANIRATLTAAGFVALIRLAKAIAKEKYEKEGIPQSCTFKEIYESGYYYERDPEKYSIMAVPVMWPRLKIPFSTAGAGDTSSSVVAVFSGK